MMLIALLLGAAAASPAVIPPAPQPKIMSTAVSPPPPMVVSISPPMPPPIIAYAQPPQPQPAPVLLDVQVSASGRDLFHGPLRVARGTGASYSESSSQASSVPCSGPLSYDGGERHSLSVQLYWNQLGEGAPAVSVLVNWQRPTPGSSCSSRGSRSVQLSQVIQLTPGHVQVIEGDAGLRVTITQR